MMDHPTRRRVPPENLSMRFLSTLSSASSNPNWLPAGLMAGLMGTAILVAGCGGDSDEVPGDDANSAELQSAPEFDSVAATGQPATLPIAIPKVDVTPPIAKPVAKKGVDEAFDEDLPTIPVEQAGAMVALEAVGAEVKLDFRDRIVAVDLKGTEFDDKSAVHLSVLKDVRTINLSETSITDAGLVHLAKLPNLRRLFLYGAAITDAGLPHLKRLTSLETLCLDETRVSDEGLSNIRGLVALEVLHLRSRLPVTDRSIPLIIRFVKLRELKVDGTKITPEGLERLKRKLPDCRIE